MNTDLDLIIIGAGVMGSVTAYEASKRGLKTLLVDQFDLLHNRGSSHGESRIMRVTYPVNKHFYSPLVLTSHELWHEAQTEVGYKVLFKTPHFNMGPSNEPIIRALVKNCNMNNVPYELLNSHQLAEKLPGRFNIPTDWVVFSNEQGGVLNPTKAVAMYQTLAHKHGTILRDNIEVTMLTKNADGVTVVTAAGENLHGKKCVVTVGPWVNKLVKRMGIELPIKIQPEEVNVYYWKINEGHQNKFTIESGFPTFASHVKDKCYFYGMPSLEYPGLIKLAVHAGSPCDPDKRLWAPSLMLNELRGWIDKTFDGMVDSSAPILSQFCLYSMTTDEDFVIDFLGGEFKKNVVLGAGFSGHGFKMAPVIGKILTDLVVDGQTKEIDMRHFNIKRF